MRSVILALLILPMTANLLLAQDDEEIEGEVQHTPGSGSILSKTPAPGGGGTGPVMQRFDGPWPKGLGVPSEPFVRGTPGC